jgi:lipopolysaccharide/colanic/teichoic acid biosynthesis glycosyltransferase
MGTFNFGELMATGQVELAHVEVVPLRDAPIGLVSRWDRIQRILDITVIVTTAPFWGPLLIVVLLAKRFIDGAPVFFQHPRVGLNGRTFMLYKIRTTAADFRARPQDWPDEGFPPRTRFGNWLRRCDLDELPQLWNVLRGEMSLVGPRPETPYHCARFIALMPRYGERWHVRPGLSGLAQLRGLRGNTDMGERCAADLEFVLERGWRLYTRILIGTLLLEARRALSL